MILHEMLRHETLAKTLLYSPRSVVRSVAYTRTTADTLPSLRMYDFIGYIDKTTFGVACDAQANFKVNHESV